MAPPNELLVSGQGASSLCSLLLDDLKPEVESTKVPDKHSLTNAPTIGPTTTVLSPALVAAQEISVLKDLAGQSVAGLCHKRLSDAEAQHLGRALLTFCLLTVKREIPHKSSDSGAEYCLPITIMNNHP